ncbi:MAG TPA: cytochrome c/FTR1 family iron permease [Burkholderiales bacterium]|nr:cytochrome c/FTR1 family iron permease [Burkholderiales bacterium]
MLAHCLLLLLIAFAPPAYARDAAPMIVHLLDYIAVDYPAFVKDGKVLDQAEYKEQQEFSAQVVELLGSLPEVRERPELLKQASHLRARIDDRAAGAEISKLASSLRWNVIGAYRIAVAPREPPDVKRGALLYAKLCSACHGLQGHGDGVAAKGMDPPPSDFHDRERMTQRSLYGLYSTITLGVDGTSMAGYPQLSEAERWALAFHVGALRESEAARGGELWRMGGVDRGIGTLQAVATLSDAEARERFGPDGAAALAWLRTNPSAATAGKETPIAFSRRLLGESAAAYRAGRHDEAQRLALTAYLEGFELAEASLDTVDDRSLRQEVETQMIAYRDLVRRGAPVERVDELAGVIDGLLAASAEKLGAEGLSPTTAAVSAFFILLREGLEALLVVAAIIAFLRKAGRPEALPWIHAGWIGALALGALTWFVAATLIEVSGATRELTEGVTALLAAAILLYVGFWLHGKAYAHAWKAFVEQHLKNALQHGTLWALAGVAFLAVYREAFETVLFYQALWQQAGEAARGSVIVGFCLAVVALAVLAWLILRYSVRLPIGLFFGASSVLLALLAVVFTGHGVKALQEAGIAPTDPLAFVTIDALGVYPSVQTLTAQAIVLAVVIAGFLYASRAAARLAPNRGRSKVPL